MAEWISVTVNEIADDVTVGHVGSMADDYEISGIPFLRSLNIEPFKLRLDGIKYINREFHERLRKSALSPGDVVIVRTGKPGACAVIPVDLPEANCSDLVIVRCGDRVRPHFLSYVVNSLAGHHIDSHTVGAVQQHFNVGSARTLKFMLPPLDVQDDILGVLKTIDDKIELNRRMNETLEASARALFRDWFVDFGPTRAKMVGQPAWLSPDLWSLFPDRLDDDGLPEGWRLLPLDQIAEFLNGLALQKFPPVPGEESVPVIKIAELRSGVSANSNRASMALPAKYVIDDGDFLFSWSGSLLAKFWTEGRGALNQHLFKVTSPDFPSWFYTQWVWHHLAEFQSIAASKATTMGHIQRGHLTAAMTVCPPPSTIGALGEVMQPLQDQLLGNLLESRTLAETRDMLLPKLMSGAIRVRQSDDAPATIGG